VCYRKLSHTAIAAGFNVTTLEKVKHSLAGELMADMRFNLDIE
jgi:hypothetical protein